jgi:hypothetical protein
MRESLTTAPAPVERAAARTILGRVLVLAVGDATAFLVFAGVGRASHHEASGLAALLQVAGTALPFALGWFAIAPLAGAFRRNGTDTLARMLRRTELAWLAAWPVSLLIRSALASDHALPKMPFPFIVLAVVAVFLGLWRGGFALVEGRLTR